MSKDRGKGTPLNSLAFCEELLKNEKRKRSNLLRNLEKLSEEIEEITKQITSLESTIRFKKNSIKQMNKKEGDENERK